MSDPISHNMNDSGVPDSFCTFSVAGTRCGVPVGRVREVVCDQPVTPVPQAHHSIRGLINLRGQILTVIDVARRLRLDSKSDANTGDAPPRFHLIADSGREMISMCVDEMGIVIHPESHEIERVTTNIDPEAAAAITGIARLPDEIVLLLDLDQIQDPQALMRSARKAMPPAQSSVRPSDNALQDNDSDSRESS